MADSTMRIILQAVDKASGVLKNVAKNAKDIGDQGGVSSKEFSMGLMKVGAAALATGLALRKAFDIGEQGAQITRLRVASGKLAESYGSSMNSIVSAVQRASQYTISEMDAMQSSARAMMLGLGADANQMGNLMEIAAYRGRVMGVSTTQAFNDIVTGIGRKSRLILDNLGIIIDSEAAYENYAASIGTTAEALDAAGQTQAYLNAVLKEGNALMEQAGGLTADVAVGYERVRRATADWWNDIKQREGRGFGSLFLSPAERKQAFIEEAHAIQQSASNYKEYLGLINEAAVGYGLQARQGRKSAVYNDAVLSRQEWENRNVDRLAKAYVQGSYARKETGADLQLINSALDLQIGLASGVTDIMEGYEEAVLKAGNGTVKLNAANKALGESLADLTLELATVRGAMDTDASYNFAVHLGLIDQKTVAFEKSLSAIAKAFETNGEAGLQAEEQTEAYWAAIDQLIANRDVLMQDKNATWSITVTMNGVALSPGQALAAGLIPGTSKGGASSYMMGAGGMVNLGPGLAAGGPAFSGQPYLVGERGPEVFVPNSSGTVLPNDQLGGVAITNRYYGNVAFTLGKDGMATSDVLRQMGVAA
jgi:hypothetical protein